jgi:regulatory protein
MAVTRDRNRRARPPFDATALEQAALSYAARYATTRARLRAYLARKLRERGWAGDGDPPIERLAERLTQSGFIDDRAFAAARAASLGRRGYGARRVGEALRAAGVEPGDVVAACAAARDDAWTAALRFAERRRIGPFASSEPEGRAREKALAAMLRAGHTLTMAKRLVMARPGEIPDADEG